MERSMELSMERRGGLGRRRRAVDDVALRSTSRSARPGLGAMLLAALAPVSMLAVVLSGRSPFCPVQWLVVPVLVDAGPALVLTPRRSAERTLRNKSVTTGAARWVPDPSTKTSTTMT